MADWAAARVQPFHPGLKVEKSASPVRLTEPGEVTYTYRVTNTGDVPLAGVAEGITDDTCSPVEYVSGDKDGDGLLDTPDSIFEDSLDETWIFECTTRVDETTKNVVTVPGIPSGPDGATLCGPDAEEGLSQVPCDVGDRDKARVVVDRPEPPGTGPDSDNGPDNGGDLGGTGAPPWLRELLLAGMALVVAGILLILAARRRRPAPA